MFFRIKFLHFWSKNFPGEFSPHPSRSAELTTKPSLQETVSQSQERDRQAASGTLELRFFERYGQPPLSSEMMPSWNIRV
jgi:hypothetical protein